MSEVRPQLLITVVHGTWPRGLFPKIGRFKQWARGLMQRKRLTSPGQSLSRWTPHDGFKSPDSGMQYQWLMWKNAQAVSRLCPGATTLANSGPRGLRPPGSVDRPGGRIYALPQKFAGEDAERSQWGGTALTVRPRTISLIPAAGSRITR